MLGLNVLPLMPMPPPVSVRMVYCTPALIALVMASETVAPPSVRSVAPVIDASLTLTPLMVSR